MTSLQKLSASESGVYRRTNLYKGAGGRGNFKPAHISSGKPNRDTPDEDAGKWAFLKKLLEVEDFHDKRRRAEARQGRGVARQKTTNSPRDGDHTAAPAVALYTDPMSSPKLSSDQVLSHNKDAGREFNLTTSKDKYADTPPQPPGARLPVSHSSQVNNKEHHQLLRSNIDQGHFGQPLLPSIVYSSQHSNQQNNESSELPTWLKGTQQGSSDNKNEGPDNDTMFAGAETSNTQHRSFGPRHSLAHGDSHSLDSLDGLNHSLYGMNNRHSVDLSQQTTQEDIVELQHVGNVQPMLSSASIESMASVQQARPLRLPPILLPRLYTIKPRPLKLRKYPVPTEVPGPITQVEWEELKECRYLRRAATAKKVRMIRQ